MDSDFKIQAYFVTENQAYVNPSDSESNMLLFSQSLLDASLFLSFRGSLMIMAMKLISLSFDIHERDYEDVGILEMFGYIFNPATYFFGLFTSFEKYKRSTGFRGFNVCFTFWYLIFITGVVGAYRKGSNRVSVHRLRF